MTMPGLFIGLVTYPRTSYPDSTTQTGLSARLRSEMTRRGWQVTTEIISHDLVPPSELDTSAGAVRRSISLEYQTEKTWYRYLMTDRANWLHRLELMMRHWWQLRLVLPAIWRGQMKAGTKRLRRLANIEAAHLALLEHASDSGCEWLLIVEDDAFTQSPEVLADNLALHLQQWSTERQPKFVNMSHSFSPYELRVENLMNPIGRWDSSSEILAADRPVTNTVCAILYRSSFAEQLVQELHFIPTQPVIPIDWKLNLALMRMTEKGLLAAGDCYTLDPGPIVQGSMRASPGNAERS